MSDVDNISTEELEATEAIFDKAVASAKEQRLDAWKADIVTHVEAIIGLAPDPRADEIVVSKLDKLAILHHEPIDAIINTSLRSVGNHYYRLPILNIKGCKSVLSLNTPCLICGGPSTMDNHKTVRMYF